MLVGCTPAPTPLPVQPIVTRTPITAPQATAATETTSFRYGILPNAADYAPTEAIVALGAVVETVETAANTDGYNLLAGFGVYEGWETITQPPITLLIDTTRPPLDDPAVASVILRAVQPAAIVDQLGIPGVDVLYTSPTANNPSELANAGYPAGITLYGQLIDAPGIALVMDQLEAAGIQIIPVDAAGSPAHITLGQTDTPSSQALYSLPLSYTTATDIPLTFSDDGWPLPVR
jgi:hypothetical protein